MIRVIKGDITKVTGFQAIVNSANNSLLGGAGVDGAIHRAAGPQLRTECRRLNGCETGESRITLGYNLPCGHIIHSVGPVWMGGTAGEEDLLKACYSSALQLAIDNNIRKLAFSAISSGEYGYPSELASKVAVAAVCDFIKDNPDSFDDICWVVQDDNTASAYAAEIKAAAPKKTEPKKKKVAKKAEKAVEEVEEEDSASDSSDEVKEEDSVSDSSDDVKEAKDSTIDASNAANETADATKEEAGSADENVASSSEENGSDVNCKISQATIPPTLTFNGAIWKKYDINWLIKELDEGKQHNYTCFWHGDENSENNILSSWYGGRLIFINGRKYDTVEQYLMSEMALLFGDTDTYELIMSEPDPAQCKKYGRNIKHFDEAAWEIVFREVIFHGNVGKAISDKEFAQALLATGDSVLIEASPFDDIYGAGMKESELLNEDGTLKVLPKEWRAYKSERQAQNVLGFVLMAVRDYLRMFSE